MSVNYQNTVQSGVISELPTEILFRVITTQRHRTNRVPDFSQLLTLLEKNVSLIVEQKRGCLKGLQKLGISEGRQQSNLSYAFNQYGRAGLCHQIATIFQDGEINWQRIFQLLDYLTDVIINNSHDILLVDQLCHYSETIHVTSGGQTLSDWISSVGQKKPTEETNRNQQGHLSKANDLKARRKKVLPLSGDFINCACGSGIMWSKNKWPFCTHCTAYPCPVEGCHINFSWLSSLTNHLKKLHTPEQIETLEVKRQQHKLHYCKCGAVKPSRGITAYKQCSTCHDYYCLKGDCSSQFGRLNSLQKHLRNHHLSVLDTECAGCGGKKLRYKLITQCPNINCAVFWCGECELVGKSFHSVAKHMQRMHKK